MNGWLFLFILALPLVGKAQVVNIENKRFNNDTARWSGHATFRFSVTENTQAKYRLGCQWGGSTSGTSTRPSL